MSEEKLLRMQFLYALRSAGVTSRAVLEAMEVTSRERFVPATFRDRAYDDVPLPISCGQTISQPSVVGMMTQALAVGPRAKVLEVGTGSGYQAAILSLLARRVYTLERHRPLARQARTLLEELGLSNVTVITSDGAQGLREQAPFDRIMVTAAAEDTPRILIEQLAEGGVMVLPVGHTDRVQTLLRIQKSAGGLDYTELADVRFVPLIEGLADDPSD